jgi:integrase
MPVRKLRQNNVHALPYLGERPKHQCIYWDAVLTGLGLRVYPSGRRTFVCGYRFHGRKRLLTLGRADVLTLDEARRKAIGYLAKLAADEDPQAAIELRRSQKTVAELCTTFIENHAKHKRVAWRGDQSCLKRHLLPKLQWRPAATVVTADIEAIHTEVGREHPYAANALLDLVRKVFNWGKVAGFVPKDHANPALGIVRFPERTRKRFITTVEMPHFIRGLEAEDNDYARHGLWLLLLLGLRSKELLNAKWSDIDWEMGTLFIGLTKNGEPLLAPLSDAALTRLKTIPRIGNNPYIICGQKPGRPLTSLGTPLKRAATRAGLQNVRVHDLRRTVGSWLAQSGVSLHLIGDILNHRDLKTTLGYACFQTEHRRDELNAHGGKVLSFAAAQLRLGFRQTVVSTEHVLCAEDRPTRHRHYFKREDLYSLVWTAPVTEIAERLGVSDVGLAKLCRRAAIPRPTRGYWARVEAGHQIGRSALPPAPENLPQLLRIRGRRQIPRVTSAVA